MFRFLLALVILALLTIGQIEAQTSPPKNAPAQGYHLPPDKYEKAVAYSRWGYALHFLGALWTAAALVGILRSGIPPRLRAWIESKTHRRFWQAVVFMPCLLFTIDIARLPISLFWHWINLRYEQSVQGWGSWLWDWTKFELLQVVAVIFLGWMVTALIWRHPRSWWFRFWLAIVPLFIFIFFIQPAVIEPLFFEFEPLAASQPTLVSAIGKVVERGNLAIPPERIYLMKASEKLTSPNAYVTGIGASKRVVVWDTTIAKMTQPQILFVFGHEMGHYVLGHIPNLILFICALLLVAMWAAYRAMGWALERWGNQWEIRGVEDWAALPLLILILTTLTFLSEPVVNTVSRYYEHQADIYGIEVTFGLIPPAAQTGAETFQILGELGLEEPNPNPLIKFWMFSHPSISERVAFVQQYDPWSTHQTRYVH
jgi:STE24 endopeptidase